MNPAALIARHMEAGTLEHAAWREVADQLSERDRLPPAEEVAATGFDLATAQTALEAYASYHGLQRFLLVDTAA